MLLQPIARLALQKGITFKDCSHFLMQAFIVEAAEQRKTEGKKINVSRIAVMSGIMRNEVKRIYALGDTNRGVEVSMPARVVDLWENDKRYRVDGRLRSLSLAEFQALVARVSKHINPGTVLFELVRVGTVSKNGDQLKLKHRVHKLASEPREAFDIAAKDLGTLLECVEENLDPDVSLDNLHIRTEYDNISEKSLRAIRRWFIAQGKLLHKRARKFLSAHDLDLPPQLKESQKGGKRAVISLITHASPLSLDEN
jgi:hypothetical protein